MTGKTVRLPRIIVAGDSISLHYGPYLTRYLKGLAECEPLKSAQGPDEDGEVQWGANCGDSARVLAFVRDRKQTGGIDAVAMLVNCGLHDIKTDPATGRKQVPLATYRENLRAILQWSAEMSVPVIWVSTTPCDEAVHNARIQEFHRFAADCRAYNEAAAAIMAEAGVPAIDLYRFTLNLGPDVFHDHVHFREHIREKQAAYSAGWLGAWLSARRER
jgi:lysophospholipase L1-like esterase